MRRTAFVLCLVFAFPALAQKEFFFGRPGSKPPNFREQDLDRKFKKSKLGKALDTGKGLDDPGCLQLIGGLLTVLAEAGPSFHNRDETFTLDPVLLEAVATQLSTPAFPAAAYLTAMIRRVLIDKRVPDKWMALAEEINPTVQIIDLGKLKWMNEGIKPVDSYLFSLPALKSRYIEEVVNANSAVTTDVAASFRDTYLLRDVVWGGAVLIDAGISKRKKGKKFDPNEIEQIGAILQWIPPDPNDREVNLLRKVADKPIPITIYAMLTPRQYLDVEKLPRGKRLIIRGQLWEMNRTVTEVEVRHVLLFEDRDWSRGVVLGDPGEISQCPMAINELTGIAPSQPGGFKH